MNLNDLLKKHEIVRGPKPNNYFCPSSGEFVADVVKEWRKAGYPPQRINSHSLGINVNSLWSKMKYGLDYLVDGLEYEDSSVKEFYAELRSRSIIGTQGDYVTLHYNAKKPSSLLESIPDEGHNDRMQQLSLLHMWLVQAHADGDEWNATAKTSKGFDPLMLEAFQQEFENLDKTQPNKYVWTATRDKITVVKFEQNLIMPETFLTT